MQVIIGLGNPGKEYENTLHNAGFNALDSFALRHNFKWENSNKFQSLISNGFFSGNKITLIKPTTYMNLSGEAVIPYINYFNIPQEEILVVVDDIDLPLGRIRIRKKGKSAGHKGLLSIIECMGSEEFPRLRVGIRPADDIITGSLKSFVLRKLSGEIKRQINVVIENIPNILETVIKDGIDVGMNKYNGIDFLLE